MSRPKLQAWSGVTQLQPWRRVKWRLIRNGGRSFVRTLMRERLEVRRLMNRIKWA